jgi:hypothetical protein
LHKMQVPESCDPDPTRGGEPVAAAIGRLVGWRHGTT